MKYINKIILSISLCTVLFACETEMVDRLDEFGLEQGGYMRQVTPYPLPAFLPLSLANQAGSKVEWVAEAVTPENGSLFATYDMTVSFVDKTPANGKNDKAAVALKSVPASAFALFAASGYPRATITVTGKEVIDALKMTAAEMAVGDEFEIVESMKLTNGKTFNSANTGVNITSGAFYSSPFFHKMRVAL